MDAEIKIAVLEGELALATEEITTLRAQLDWFAEQQDLWRSKYLKEHPELDNWDYAENPD